VQRSAPTCVLGAFGSGNGPTLLINAHVDVVPTGEAAAWTRGPFEPHVRDGRLYGRGACDTKGGLAAALHALETIAAAGIELPGTVVVAPVYGEEDGGSGTVAALERVSRADGCIVIEPTELSVVPAVAGALSFRIALTGRSAHGALREEGVSAIERLPLVQHALLELEQRRNAEAAEDLFAWLSTPFSICVGRVRGGDWASNEADWAVLEGRYGVAPDENLDDARAALERAIAEAADTDGWLREHPPAVSWVGGQYYPARTSSATVLAAMTAGVTAGTGSDATVRGMPYGCDMGITVGAAGIPTVVFGPGDIRAAHRPDEHVPVDDLDIAARAIAIAVLEFFALEAA
jgi:acetylornithine deacetylase